MNKGFTLIELSIVLVIIGLIVGGVLVGKDLINAAALRGTISQYEKFNTAVNTFKLKYNGLPADLERSRALAFAFVTTYASHPVNNNNGLINGPNQGSDPKFCNPSGEILLFWKYLSDAKLIDEVMSYLIQHSSGNTDLTLPGSYATNAGSILSEVFPRAKIGGDVFWIVGSNLSENFFGLISTNGTAYGGQYNNPDLNSAMTPISAYNMDSKIDDGLPNTGNIQARGRRSNMSYVFGNFELMENLNSNNSAQYAASPSSGTCIAGGASSTDATNIYATAAASGSVSSCNLRLKFQ